MWFLIFFRFIVVFSPLILGFYFLFTTFRIFRALNARKRLVAKYAPVGRYATDVRYTPTIGKAISDEEFEEIFTSLEAKVPNPRVGLVGLASPKVRAVLAEAITGVGGGTAALLQTAHPFVGKGIFDHSNVLEEPHIRFERTFYYIFKIYFGDLPSVIKAGRAVRKLHSRVSGTLSTKTGTYEAGSRYGAYDLEAVKWVYASLMETQIFLHDLLIRRLSYEDKGEVLRYMRNGAVVFGLRPTEFPDDYREFEEYFFTVCNSPLLTVTPESQEICDALMKPILYEKYIPFTNTLKTISGILMPEPIAVQYGFDIGFFSQFYGSMVLAAMQTLYTSFPVSFRYLTAFLEAEARENDTEVSYHSRLVNNFGLNLIQFVLSSHGKGKKKKKKAKRAGHARDHGDEEEGNIQ